MTRAVPLVPLCFLGMPGRARLASGAPVPPGGIFDLNEHQNAAKRETPVGDQFDGQPPDFSDRGLHVSLRVWQRGVYVLNNTLRESSYTPGDKTRTSMVQHHFLPNPTRRFCARPNETLCSTVSTQSVLT